MKARLIFLGRMSLYWLLSFSAAKGLFLLINYAEAGALTWGDLAGVVIYSLRMDISMVAYLLLLPMVWMAAVELSGKSLGSKKVLSAYTLLIQGIVGTLCLMDAMLYGYWGYRLDIAPILLYWHSPADVMASAGWREWLLAPVLLLGWLWLSWRGLRFFRAYIPVERGRWYAAWWLGVGGMLVIPMRGGIQQIPINPGIGYFSDRSFANHATVNPVWNVLYTYSHRHQSKPVYAFWEDSRARAYFNQLRDTVFTADSSFRYLPDSVEMPNVLCIIVESLTASAVPRLGGEAIAVRFDELAQEGVFFSNFYANGDRSEKGVVSILSGFPPLPAISPADLPDRIHKLPSLMKDFKARGYQTAFYTGAEGSFANLGAYMRSQFVDELVEKADFPAEQRSARWGVPDHLVFDYCLEALQRPHGKPFFSIIETLSSHEPFDVPPPVRFAGQDEASLFRNALAYTDDALGDFIAALRQTDVWESLWVIIVADHGHRLPQYHGWSDPRRFHIPMLWLGGVMQGRDTVISTFAAQTDIPCLVAQQLGWRDAYTQYPFGKPLGGTPQPHAFYTFNNGYGLLTDKGNIVYDHTARRNTWMSPDFPQLDSLGKSYLQVLEQAFLRYRIE